MIVHQAIGMAAPCKAMDHVSEQREEGDPISVVCHHILPRVPATRDMIDRPGVLNALWPCHRRANVANVLRDYKT